MQDSNFVRVPATRHERPTSSRRRAVRIGERGEGKLAAVVWIAILALVAMAGFEWVPKRYRVAQLQDHMTEMAEQAGLRYRSAEQMEKDILWKARELGLPVTEKSFKVELSGSAVTIRGEYEMILDFPLYDYRWPVRHEIHRRIFRV